MALSTDALSPTSQTSYLIYALQGLGDSLEATPLLAALRDANRSCRIDVAVTRPSSAQLFRGLSRLVTEVIELPYWERGAVAFSRAVLLNCRKRLYDVSFMTYPGAKRVYHALNATFRAKEKVGHRYAEPGVDNFLPFYTKLFPVRQIHNVDRNLDLLSCIGIPRPCAPQYVLPASWIDGSARDTDSVILHVGTIAHDGFTNKRWPLRNFATVADVLRDRGYQLSLLMGPDERKETIELHRHIPYATIHEGNIVSTARRISKCGVVITNDSGIGHLAAGTKTPVISLFGPTPVTGAPYGVNSYALRPSTCAPCFDPLARELTCALGIDFRCLRADLTVDFVIRTADAVLQAGKLAAPSN